MADDQGSPQLKRCSRCQEWLPANTDSFPANKAQRCGLHAQCRKCRSEVRRAAYADDVGGYRTKKLAHLKACHEADPEASRAAKKRSRDAVRAADPEAWRAKKRAEMAARSPEHRQRNLRRWREANPNATREHSAKARLKDPLRSRISCMVSFHLRRNGLHRSRKSFETLFGYDVDTLRAHLARQFTGGMTWENYGPVWEVDHIIPLHTFKITSLHDDEFRAAWALTNLRPLSVIENRSKGGKRTLLL